MGKHNFLVKCKRYGGTLSLLEHFICRAFPFPLLSLRVPRRLATKGTVGGGSSSLADPLDLSPRPPFLRLLSEPKQSSVGSPVACSIISLSLFHGPQL